MSKKVIAYFRANSQKQIEAKTELLNAFASENNLEIIETISERENGIRGYQNLVCQVVHPDEAFDGILCPSATEIWKNTEKFLGFLSTLRFKNIDFYTVDMGLIEDTQHTKILSLTVLLAVAQYQDETKNQQEKLRKSKKEEKE